MAHAISLTDGTTTINLTLASGYLPTDYAMDSTDFAKLDDPEITASITLQVTSSSGPNVQALVNAVELMAVAAFRRKQKPASFPKVFLQLQVDGDANTYRAEIIDCKLKPGENFLNNWFSFNQQAVLLVTHKAWEGPRKELSISSNGNGAATGGRAITNNANNWIGIASSQVGGVLPTPVELQLTNTSGASRSYRHFFLATNAFSDPANFSHRLGSTSGTMALASGQYVLNLTYALSSTVMQDTQGRAFKPIIRLTTLGGAVYVRSELQDSSGNFSLTPDTQEKYIPALTTAFIELDSLALPPGGYQTAWAGTQLWLRFRGAGAYAVAVESVQLTPTDSYQYIAQLGFSVANNDVVTFDNIEELYHYAGLGVYSNKAGRLMVWPGVTQRILILQDEGSSSTTTQTMSVRAYIRERRLTV